MSKIDHAAVTSWHLDHYGNHAAIAALMKIGQFWIGAEIAEAGLAKLVDLFSGDVWSQIRQRSAGWQAP